MSGSDDTRSDSRDYGSGKAGGPGAADSCMISLRGPINSPQAAALAGAVVGDTLRVIVDNSGVAPVLVVETLFGARAGSLTMANYLQVIACIGRGHTYEATIMAISGGVHDVRVSRV